MAKKLAKKLAKKQSGGSEDKYAYKKSVYPDGPTFKPTSPTQDSTKYYTGKSDYYKEAAKNLKTAGKDTKPAYREVRKALSDRARQSKKGVPGFDEYGNAMKKSGGSTKAKKK